MDLKPIQLLKQSEAGLDIDTDYIFSLLDSIGEKQIAILSIIGEKHTGKSLLLNFIFNYLKNNKSGQDFVTVENECVLNGFDLRGSDKEQAFGMRLWPESFAVKAEDDSETILLLLDTQGLSLEKSCVEDSGVMFALSLLLSSIVVINFKIDINEDYWRFYEHFARFANTLNDESELFQKLVFLVRDWDDEDVYRFGCHDDNTTDDNNYKKDKIDSNDNHSDEVRYTRNRFLSCYDDTSSYLLPHPGKRVLKQSFTGQLEAIDIDFVEDVAPKTIGASKLTGTSLKSHLIKWQILITNHNSKDNKVEKTNEPENTSLTKISNDFDKKIETNYDLAVECAYQMYENIMHSVIETNPSDNELVYKHVNARDESVNCLTSQLLDKTNDSSKDEVIVKLVKRIEIMYEVFREQNLHRIDDQKCKAFSDLPKQKFSQKTDKCVALELQCPVSYRGICDSEQKLWFCADCGHQLEYGFDEFFYCFCGKANVYSFKFKCNDNKHSFNFIQFPYSQLKQLLSDKEINILILGETGVGKSTWINGFVNYITYPLLAEAKKHDLLSLIASSFTITDNEYQMREITCGVDTNENFKTGQSATKDPKAYTFDCDNKLIRLIDTPGIGDTRGIEQDKKNFDAILRYLSNLDKLHGICILLKPNNARLGVMFRFCIKELLTHLHRDASRNIVFCFTNARSTFYKPGDTMPALQSLLRKNQEVKIKLCKDTIYCMDNESFRFLCALHHKVEFDDEECDNYSKRWDKSVTETKRMLNYICGLTPHAVSNTLSLNDTRKIIVSLSKPMADITQNILTNINVVEDKKEELQNTKANEKNLKRKLYLEVIQLKATQLGYPRTVCTDKKCVKFHNIEGSAQYTTEFVTHCHTQCYLSGIEAEKYPNPALKSCAAMAGNENCEECGCSWEKHMHITYEQKQIKVKVIDEAVKGLLKNKQTFREAIKLQIRKNEKFVEELKKEKKTITNVSVKFGGFLKANSIVPYNDALGEYLDVLIRMEKDKVSAGGDRKTLDGLEQMRNDYEEEVRLLDMCMADGKEEQLTSKDVNDLVKQLFSLKHKGKVLKQIMDVVSSSKSQMHKFQETNYRSKYAKRTVKNLKKADTAAGTYADTGNASVDYLKMPVDFLRSQYNKFKLPSVPFFTQLTSSKQQTSPRAISYPQTSNLNLTKSIVNSGYEREEEMTNQNNIKKKKKKKRKMKNYTKTK